MPALALLSYGYPDKPKIKETARAIESRMVKVNDTFYIARTELTNEDMAGFWQRISNSHGYNRILQNGIITRWASG